MQILYFTMFMISLVTYAILSLPPAEERFKQDNKVFAVHMSSWHRAAMQECIDNGCAGSVDATPSLPSVISGSPAFATARFETNYDAASNFLLTNVLAGVPASTGLSFPVIISGLNEGLNGESSSIGIFKSAGSRVVFTTLSNSHTRPPVNLPAALSAGVPDGAPVIISSL